MQMKRIKSLRIGAAFVLALIVIAGSMIAIETVRARRKAERLMAEVRALRVGDSNLDKVYQLVERYNGRVRDGDKCKTAECTVEIIITNQSLSRYHLASWTFFGVTFFIRQGRTVRISLVLESEIKDLSYFFKRLVYGQEIDFVCVASISDDLEYSKYNQSGERYRVVARRDVENRPERLIVLLSPTVDAVTRDKALAFNLGCLSKLGGCRDASEFLPAVWREIEARHSPTTETP